MRRLVLLATLLALPACARPTLPPVAPEVAGATHRESTFAGHGDLALYTQSWRPAAPRAALIVVHGLKDHSANYVELAGRLTAEGFAVHALDLRGHGRSPGERSFVTSFAEHTGDLEKFVAHVRAAEPGLPIFLFGHSMGGAIATTYTLDHQDQVAGLVLSAAALQLDPKVSPGLVKLTRKLGAKHPTWRVLKLKPKHFSRDPAVVAAVRGGDPLVDAKKIPASTAAALIDAIDRIQRDAPKLTVPLLILHGDADRITPPAGSRALHDRAASRDKTLTLLPGFFHDLLHEPDHERVLVDITRWLLTHASPTPSGGS